MIKLKFLLLLVTTSFYAPTFAFTVAVPVKNPILPIGFLAGTTSGHEEITRQALVLLNNHLKAKGISLDELSPEILAEKDAGFSGASGLNSGNSIIRGNYATDLPNVLTDHFNLPNWYHMKIGAWNTNPDVQFVHFLRNIKPGEVLASQQETCIEARNTIIKSTIDGINLWHVGNIRSALFLVGHASHTIQDSFSRAHTKRSDAEHNYDLLNVCYYGNRRDTHTKTCRHHFIDFRDDIWMGSPIDIIKRIFALIIPSEEIREDSLKETATLARTASLRYLYLVTDYLFKNKDKPANPAEVTNLLTDQLFEGRSGNDAIDKGLAAEDEYTQIVMPRGIMSCNALNSQDDHAPLEETHFTSILQPKAAEKNSEDSSVN